MKTTSLAKAPVGYVAHVIEPNQVGYTKLVDLPVGDITLQALIDGLKTAIGKLEEKNNNLELALEKQDFKLVGLQEKLAEQEKRILALETLEVIL